MKIYVVLLAFVLAFSGTIPSAMAQDTVLTKKEQKKLEREKKKKERAAENEAVTEKLVKLLSHRFFVFKATRVYDNSGRSFSVSPTINFLSVIDTLVTFQFGFDQLIGWNGVGGVTSEGYTEGYVFNENKDSKRPMTVQSRVRPVKSVGSPYFTITVMNDGQADLNLTTSRGGTIRMSGEIWDPRDAGIYKGTVIW
ncbi:MAG: DUF4251 domain-containing protein [Chlorobi bacterium]|nr:DUF4251 domain-containing protein [Chlorobiota bacterium]